MKHTINIKGYLVTDGDKLFYDWFGITATCPRDVNTVVAKAVPGDEIEVYVNSGGGLINVGSEIYTVLREAAQKCDVKIYITGEACSAASVIACAAYCEMSPTALMMVHCVSSSVNNGNHAAMEHMAETLSIADRAMCTAYMAKAGMSEQDALDMMERETWLTAQQAVERGLVDKVMFQQEEEPQPLVAGPAIWQPTQEQKARVIDMIVQSGEFEAFLQKYPELQSMGIYDVGLIGEEGAEGAPGDDNPLYIRSDLESITARLPEDTFLSNIIDATHIQTGYIRGNQMAEEESPAQPHGDRKERLRARLRNIRSGALPERAHRMSGERTVRS